MSPILVRELRKRYGAVEVLHGIDLAVPRGSLYGFLGPNGAGKTTLIRILLGLLRANGGEAQVFGEDAWRHGPRLRARIGYLPGDVRFYPGLTGRAMLDYFARTRGVDARREIRRLADAFELDLDKRVRNYSRGMKQKLGLIQALMHAPELLILDEPTTALDPLMQGVLYSELRAFAGRDGTVLFSSHTLSEVEELCDQVAILRSGRVIEQERIEVLRGRAVRRIEMQFARDVQRCDPPAGLRLLHEQNGRVCAAWSGPMEPLLSWLARNRVTDLTIAPPDLEQLFLAYYSDGGPA